MRKINAVPYDTKPVYAVEHIEPHTMRSEQRGTILSAGKKRWPLHAFLDGEEPIRWWQVSGAGGQGKSRLGLHLVDTIAPDWHAGFLNAQDLKEVDWNKKPLLTRQPSSSLII